MHDLPSVGGGGLTVGGGGRNESVTSGRNGSITASGASSCCVVDGGGPLAATGAGSTLPSLCATGVYGWLMLQVGGGVRLLVLEEQQQLYREPHHF
jgi:hypothetical protein